MAFRWYKDKAVQAMSKMLHTCHPGHPFSQDSWEKSDLHPQDMELTETFKINSVFPTENQ